MGVGTDLNVQIVTGGTIDLELTSRPVNVNIVDGATIELEFTGVPANADDIGKVKTSGTDTTAGYLSDKLYAGSNIALSEVTITGTKKIQIDSTGGGSQTPWTSDIDADGFDLGGVGDISAQNIGVGRNPLIVTVGTTPYTLAAGVYSYWKQNYGRDAFYASKRSISVGQDFSITWDYTRWVLYADAGTYRFHGPTGTSPLGTYTAVAGTTGTVIVTEGTPLDIEDPYNDVPNKVLSSAGDAFVQGVLVVRGMGNAVGLPGNVFADNYYGDGSNLTGVVTSSFATDIYPTVSNTYNLGANTNTIKDVYIAGKIDLGTKVIEPYLDGVSFGSPLYPNSGLWDSTNAIGVHLDNRQLIASDGSSSMIDWSNVGTSGNYYFSSGILQGDGSGLTNIAGVWKDNGDGTIEPTTNSNRVLINGATDDATSALQVAGQIYSNTGISVGGLPDYGQLLWLNGAGSGTEAIARLNNIDGDAWFDATSGHYQGFRFGFNQSYWQWTAGIDSTDNDTFGFYPGAAQPYGSFALKLLQSGRVLMNSATDDTTSALIVSGVINTDTGYSVGASTGYTGDLNDSTSTKIADVVGGIITAVYY